MADAITGMRGDSPGFELFHAAAYWLYIFAISGFCLISISGTHISATYQLLGFFIWFYCTSRLDAY